MALAELVHGERVNAVLGWASTAAVALAAVESFLTNAFLWGGLALAIVAIVSLPSLAWGDPSAFVPWPLPFVAALSVGLRAIEVWAHVTEFVAIGSMALIFVVELEVFTEVELSRRFVAVFAMLTTMALQALWTIAQFFSDRWLGTAFLRSQVELQWAFVYVTGVGLALGALAVGYFERFEPVGSFERPPSR